MDHNQDDDGWSHPSRVAAGRALLTAEGGATTAGAVSNAIGRDPSNTRRTLERLVSAGLVKRVPLPASRRRRGRAPACAYALSEDGRARLLDVLKRSAP